MVELNWTHEAEQWLHDIYDYIPKENPDAAFQTIESIYKKVQILKEFPESGYCYNHNHSHHIRILLYGHYRIAYSLKFDRNIDILGVFHGSLDIESYLRE